MFFSKQHHLNKYIFSQFLLNYINCSIYQLERWHFLSDCAESNSNKSSCNIYKNVSSITFKTAKSMGVLQMQPRYTFRPSFYHFQKLIFSFNPSHHDWASHWCGGSDWILAVIPPTYNLFKLDQLTTPHTICFYWLSFNHQRGDFLP